MCYRIIISGQANFNWRNVYFAKIPYYQVDSYSDFVKTSYSVNSRAALSIIVDAISPSFESLALVQTLSQTI